MQQIATNAGVANMIQIKAHTCKLYAINKKPFGLILSITSWFRVERMSKTKQNNKTFSKKTEI